MAKAKKTKDVPVDDPVMFRTRVLEFKVVDKKLKSGGKTYRLTEASRPSMKGPIMPVDTVFKECADDFYQVFEPSGDKSYFRIGPKLIGLLPTIQQGWET